MNYDTVFIWVGYISSGFFILLGMGFFASIVMNFVWRKFKDGKELANVIMAYGKYKDEL